jgi:predicted RNA-binding Zn ribbon-like protein
VITVEWYLELPFELSEMGILCLDFVNTVDSRSVARPRDLLKTYADLVHWAARQRIIADDEVLGLQRLAERAPAAAEAARQSALAVREAIYGLFAAALHRQPPRAADMAVFNESLARALAHLRIAPEDVGFGWTWSKETELDRVLWPVVRSAAELLTSDQRNRIGECAGRDCGWLFLDTSRNHTRRWCDMKDCGNRAKARRHYQRQRALETPTVTSIIGPA